MSPLHPHRLHALTCRCSRCHVRHPRDSRFWRGLVVGVFLSVPLWPVLFLGAAGIARALTR